MRLRLDPAAGGRGIAGWSVRGLRAPELDGLPTALSERPPVSGREHPNGAVAIDHLVAFSPDLDRSVPTLQSAGIKLARLREGPTPGGAERQAFFRMGELLLELIEAPEGSRLRSAPDAAARFWGIAFLVDGLERPAALLGDRLGRARPALQPGRRIATLRREAGLGTAVAFITPGRGAA